VVILTHNGKNFTAGLDLASAASISENADNKEKDAARLAWENSKIIKVL
jgi:enoyl-CoA hydratase/carnithine racemase